MATSLAFDLFYYLDQRSDVLFYMAENKLEPDFALWHFNNYGWREGTNPNASFDVKTYLDTYPDIKDADVNPFQHFWDYGAAEGRNPNAEFLEQNIGANFDAETYLAANPDVKAAVNAGTMLTAYQHYVLYGQFEGREGRVFDAESYLDENPDVAAAVNAGTMTAYQHYVLYGQAEGREGQFNVIGEEIGNAPVVTDAEFDLALGDQTVGQVVVTDADGNDTITALDIVAGNTDRDNDGTLPFAIATNGDLTVTDPDDVVAGSTVELTVRATDNTDLKGEGTVTVNVAATPAANVVDFDATPNATATSGVDIFVYDYTSVSGRAVGLDGLVSVAGFDAEQDIIRLVDEAGTITDLAGIQALGGLVVTSDPFEKQTTLDFDPNAGSAQVITLTGIEHTLEDLNFQFAGSSSNSQPIVADAEFDLNLGSQAVGRVVVSDADGNNTITSLQIIAGNTDSDSDGNLPFAIAVDGSLTVNDQGDLSAGSTVELTVQATDNTGLKGEGAVTVNVTGAAAANIVDFDTTPNATATSGVDIFVYDYTSASGRAVGQDGSVTVTGFDATQDSIRLVDAAGTITDLTGLQALGGFVVAPDPFGNQTTLDFDPNAGAAQVITLVGVQHAVADLSLAFA
ncbi:hypothetical protein SAMN05421644_11049 [Allochromatium warmingii]|uniref:Cadherin domain-containing protein n=1 Tax=Allochromatium warmingii TaxID=61595 RepID=A0A1H3DZ19_ALLWA|nr:cadherin repeat domain-containing protein [Allochromatium warmingii]SDX70914.1 hypothetical protein SAMN05421644_11049 [Allochromatium warmingii]